MPDTTSRRGAGGRRETTARPRPQPPVEAEVRVRYHFPPPLCPACGYRAKVAENNGRIRYLYCTNPGCRYYRRKGVGGMRIKQVGSEVKAKEQPAEPPAPPQGTVESPSGATDAPEVPEVPEVPKEKAK